MVHVEVVVLFASLVNPIGEPRGGCEKQEYDEREKKIRKEGNMHTVMG